LGGLAREAGHPIRGGVDIRLVRRRRKRRASEGKHAEASDRIENVEVAVIVCVGVGRSAQGFYGLLCAGAVAFWLLACAMFERFRIGER
jgi:hypothetical protein